MEVDEITKGEREKEPQDGNLSKSWQGTQTQKIKGVGEEQGEK